MTIWIGFARTYLIQLIETLVRARSANTTEPGLFDSYRLYDEHA